MRLLCKDGDWRAADGVARRAASVDHTRAAAGVVCSIAAPVPYPVRMDRGQRPLLLVSLLLGQAMTLWAGCAAPTLTVENGSDTPVRLAVSLPGRERVYRPNASHVFLARLMPGQSALFEQPSEIATQPRFNHEHIVALTGADGVWRLTSVPRATNCAVIMRTDAGWSLEAGDREFAMSPIGEVELLRALGIERAAQAAAPQP